MQEESNAKVEFASKLRKIERWSLRTSGGK